MGQSQQMFRKNSDNLDQTVNTSAFSSKKRKWFRDFDRVLHEGCDKKILNMLVNQVLISDTYDDYNENLLHYVTRVNNEVVTKFLIKAGCDVNHKNYQGNPPLANAIWCGNRNIVEILLKAGASPDNRGFKDNFGPLHIAANRGDVPMLKLLMEAGASIHALTIRRETPLHMAVKDTRGRGGVAIALDKCKYETAKLLIEAGSRVNEVDVDGNTSLHYAAEIMELETLKLLLENGASAIVCNDKDLDPLCYHLDAWEDFYKNVQFTAQQIEIVKLLLKYGANVNRITRYDKSPLGIALRAVDGLGTAKCLLNNGATLDFHIPVLERFDNMKTNALSFKIKYAAMFETQGKKERLLNFDSNTLEGQLGDYYESCVKELDLMQTMKVSESSIIWKILEGKLNPRYTMNEQVARAFSGGQISTLFPIYGDVLTDRFLEDLQKQELIMKGYRGLSRVLQGWEDNALPDVFETICSYLTNQDLQVLALV